MTITRKPIYVLPPQICADHRVDWRHLADEDSWPLLEQAAPQLCADRIDSKAAKREHRRKGNADKK
jgi:hypothetical protein